VTVTEIITGQADAGLVEDGLDGKEGGLAVEGVEDRLDEKEVHAGGDERADLLRIGGEDLVPGDGAEVGPVDVGRHRERAVERADGAGDEAVAAGSGGLGLAGGAAGAGDGGGVELGDDGLQMVVGLGDGRGAEGVGLDDIGAGGEVVGVDLGDEVGAGEREQVVVALEVVRVGAEAVAAEVRLGERVRLDHRAHGAVEHDDAPAAERGEAFEVGRGRGHGRETGGIPALGKSTYPHIAIH
jgi:hypothetical protein